MTDLEAAENAICAIIEEFQRGAQRNGDLASAHEGYAVILEELDELWDEVRKRDADRDYQLMLKEAVQVGACAMRFAVDICLKRGALDERLRPNKNR